MTEEEWGNEADPDAMIDLLAEKASHRKLRLFAVACCQLTPIFSADQIAVNGTIVSEKFADGISSLYELRTARRLVNAAWEHLLVSGVQGEPAWSRNVSLGMSYQVTRPDAYRAASEVMKLIHRVQGWVDRSMQAKLLREIFGNPFRPVTFDPRWRTPDVLPLANAIYEDRAFDRMPILADALMDAGCDNEDILAHCRSDGPHVRGCWVVDLVLGKE